VEQAEIEMLVGELETRMDRLRALYDQYFMGIERLEPLVPRKDVERRMAVLRKEQIRNTGLRFKFQTLTQRFNTYQTYWIRISRQIEQGTYKRDVMRATARFGVDPMKERTASEQDSASSSPSSAPRVYIPDEPIEELQDGTAYLIPLDAEDDPFADLTVPPAAPAAPRERFASTVKLDLDELADPFEEHDPFPKPASPASAPKIRLAQRSPVPKSPPPEAELHRDTERRMPIAPVSTPMRIAPRAATPSAAPSSPGEPKIVIAKRASIPDEAERRAVSGPSAAPGAPAPPPSRPSLQRPGTLPGAGPALGPSPRPPAALPTTGSPPRVTLQKPGTLPSAIPASASQKPAPAAAAPPVAAASASPPPRPPAAHTPSAPTIPRAAPAGPSTISDPPAPAPARSAPPRVAAPARSAPARAAVSAPPAPAPSRIGDLSGDRFGQIYSKYVETRRAHNEPTHAITREALAKQLSDSTERLKQKHGGKPIDFEVVVKDGKTILRPVVK
jgi:hypothetical protein